MQNEYIMTSIDSDEQFVDNMADASVNNPEYMTDEERSEANDLYLADVEFEYMLKPIEETSYQMSDEEQAGLEEYLDDEPYEPIDDVLVDDLMNLCFCQPTQAELEEQRLAEERIKEKSRRLEQGKKAKQNKLPPSNLFMKYHRERVNRLANKFNKGVK